MQLTLFYLHYIQCDNAHIFRGTSLQTETYSLLFFQKIIKKSIANIVDIRNYNLPTVFCATQLATLHHRVQNHLTVIMQSSLFTIIFFLRLLPSIRRKREKKKPSGEFHFFVFSTLHG